MNIISGLLFQKMKYSNYMYNFVFLLSIQVYIVTKIYYYYFTYHYVLRNIYFSDKRVSDWV